MSAGEPLESSGTSGVDETTLARKVAVTTVSLVVSRVVVVIAGMFAVGLAARYLGRPAYGALVTAMAFAATFAVLSDLGLSTVAAREIAREPERRRAILGALVTSGYVYAALAGALAVAVMFVAYAGSDQTRTRQAIAILLVQLVAAPVSAAARAHFVAAQRGWLLGAGEMALALTMVAATAVVVAAGLGFLAAVSAVAAGYVAQAVVLGWLAHREGALAFAGDWQTAWRLLRRALPLAATVIVSYLYLRIDVVLLSWLKSDSAVALYGVAYRVVEAFIVLPMYFMLAAFPAIAREGADRERMRQIITPALGAMQAFALPVVILTAVYAGPLIDIIGGERFAGAAAVLRILMLAVGVSFLNGVYGNALLALGRQAALLRLMLTVLAFNIALNAVLIPPYGVKGAAWAVVLSELAGLLAVRRLYVVTVGRPGTVAHGRIAVAVVGLAPAVAVGLLLRDSLGSLGVTLLGGAVGVLGYGLALVRANAVPELAPAHLLSRRPA